MLYRRTLSSCICEQGKKKKFPNPLTKPFPLLATISTYSPTLSTSNTNIRYLHRNIPALSFRNPNRIICANISTTSTLYMEENDVQTTKTTVEDNEINEDDVEEEDENILTMSKIDVCVCSPSVIHVAELANEEAKLITMGDELLPKDISEEEKERIMFLFNENENDYPTTFSLGAYVNHLYQNRPLKYRSTKDIYIDTGIVIPSTYKPPTPKNNHPPQHPTVISSSLRLNLLTAINNYTAKSTTRIDYHPGSDNKVQDIVHPSLYPYVHGLSVITEGEKNTTTTTITMDRNNTNIESTLFDSLAFNFITKKDNLPPKVTDKDSYRYRYSKELDHYGRSINYSPTYQWLPSEFYVNKEGKVTINSYINNLPTEETELYTLIGQAFEHLVPYFELTWSYGKQMNFNGVRNNFSDGQGNETFLTGIGDLRDKHLQVITKIVRIRLEPIRDVGKNRLNGAWHAEGMSNEFIVATGSITLQQSTQFRASLQFKRNFTEDEAGSCVSTVWQNPPHYISQFLERECVPLGTMNIEEGDTVVFPNSHIHRLDMYNDSFDYNGERTILVFWLVDPSKRIVSTKHVKEQQTNNPAFTFDVALQHRLALMKERSKVKQQYQQAELNLCEH